MSVPKVAVDSLPLDPVTGNPILPMAQPGYYPGFSTLSQQKFWDAMTRQVVLDRVNQVPPVRFFNPQEARLMKAICDRVLPQDDRDESHKIPIMEWIDDRLFKDEHDGYRYEDMPPDREAYRLGLKAIDEIAHHEYHAGFRDICAREQEQILRSLHDAKPTAAHHIWKHMSVHRFFMLLVTDCADAYYSHPYAWDEIGFGGPAYPRAYMRLERGEAEPWEVDEKRYAWRPPADSLSGEYECVAGESDHFGSPSQGGTH